MRKISSEMELLNTLNQEGSGPLLFFKHSERCPISAMAFNEFRMFSEKYPHIPCAVIDVLQHRSVSNLLAEKVNVEHASPQVVAVSNGKMYWYASHHQIHLEALENNNETSLSADF